MKIILCDKINSSAAMMMRFLSLSSFAAAGYLSNRREPGNLEQRSIFFAFLMCESRLSTAEKKLLIVPAEQRRAGRHRRWLAKLKYENSLVERQNMSTHESEEEKTKVYKQKYSHIARMANIQCCRHREIIASHNNNLAAVRLYTAPRSPPSLINLTMNKANDICLGEHDAIPQLAFGRVFKFSPCALRNRRQVMKSNNIFSD